MVTVRAFVESGSARGEGPEFGVLGEQRDAVFADHLAFQGRSVAEGLPGGLSAIEDGVDKVAHVFVAAAVCGGQEVRRFVALSGSLTGR